MTDLDRLLSFAARSRVPGGFGYQGNDGTLLTDRPVETWISARMTHVFGLAALLGHRGAVDLVAQEIRFADHYRVTVAGAGHPTARDRTKILRCRQCDALVSRALHNRGGERLFFVYRRGDPLGYRVQAIPSAPRT